MALALRVLAIATLVAWAPLASLLTGSVIATTLGCAVDEGAVRPCVAGGVDLGPILYQMTVAGWFILGVWPFMLLTAIAWFGVLVWMIVRRLGRRRSRELS